MTIDALARGRTVYGTLDPVRDPRNFRGEATEELRDALVYLGAELVRLAGGGK